MNAWDEWLERERAKLGDRALDAVQLLTRIRLEDAQLWQQILDFAGKGETNGRNDTNDGQQGETQRIDGKA